jgi:hypothetical protein
MERLITRFIDAKAGTGAFDSGETGPEPVLCNPAKYP